MKKLYFNNKCCIYAVMVLLLLNVLYHTSVLPSQHKSGLKRVVDLLRCESDFHGNRAR
jgi:hypothetical protein